MRTTLIRAIALLVFAPLVGVPSLGAPDFPRE